MPKKSKQTVIQAKDLNNPAVKKNYADDDEKLRRAREKMQDNPMNAKSLHGYLGQRRRKNQELLDATQ